jgi:chromosome segregation ATPase
MQGRLEAQKVQLDAEMADLEQKMVSAKTAFNDYKNQHKKLEREEARLQQLLQEPTP